MILLNLCYDEVDFISSLPLNLSLNNMSKIHFIPEQIIYIGRTSNIAPLIQLHNLPPFRLHNNSISSITFSKDKICSAS